MVEMVPELSVLMAVQNIRENNPREDKKSISVKEYL